MSLDPTQQFRDALQAISMAEAIRILHQRISLADVGLSEQDAENRRNFIGGSDARIIAKGDPDAILDLWRGKVGIPLPKPKSFEDVLHVQLGHWTEPLNRLWFEKRESAKVFGAGGQFRCDEPGLEFMGTSQDGRTMYLGREMLFEAKHVNGFKFDREEHLAYYWPQLQHNLYVTGLDAAVLSTLIGTGGYICQVAEADPVYQHRLIEMERTFWEAVTTRSPPSALPELADSAPRSRKVDMTGNNEWAAAAHDFRETKEAHGTHEKAKQALKEMVPEDAIECSGHGVTTKVSASGSISTTIDKTAAEKAPKKRRTAA